MRAIAIGKGGTPVAPHVVVLDDVPCPEPGPGELRVKTEASALNHLDLWVGMGIPGVDRPYPRITGSDGVGIVEKLGSGVDTGWLGKRVILNAAIASSQQGICGKHPAGEQFHLIGEQIPGCLAEYFVAPASNVLPIDDVDPCHGAAYGLVHLTSWRMLVKRAGIRPGQSVLIPGIGGGVALACLSIAKYFGCQVLVTSRVEEKLNTARLMGADHGIIDSGQDFSREVRTLTEGRGVDICAESIGKATHMACLKSLARGGVLVSCGCTSGPVAETDLARIFWNQLSILGSTMGDMAEFREVVSLLRSGALRPCIDSVYPVEEGQEAFHRLEDGVQTGKIVIDWRDGAPSSCMRGNVR